MPFQIFQKVLELVTGQMPSGCRFRSSRWLWNWSSFWPSSSGSSAGCRLDAVWIDGEGLGTGHPSDAVLIHPGEGRSLSDPSPSSSGCRLDQPMAKASERFILWMPSGHLLAVIRLTIHPGEGRSLSDPSPVILWMPPDSSRRPRSGSSSGRHPLDAVSDLPEGLGTGHPSGRHPLDHPPDAVWMPSGSADGEGLGAVHLLAVHRLDHPPDAVWSSVWPSSFC